MSIRSEELKNIKKEFLEFKNDYIREKTLRKHLENVIKNLKEELDVSIENERSRFYEINDKNNILFKQNEIISKHLNATEENLKLKEDIKHLNKICEELKENNRQEVNDSNKKIEKLKLYHDIEIQKLTKHWEEKVINLNKETEFLKNEFDKRVNALKEEIINLKKEKEEESNLTVLLYEDKLHKLEEELKESHGKIAQCHSNYSSTIQSYQKRIEVLERNTRPTISLPPQLPLKSSMLSHSPMKTPMTPSPSKNRFKPLPAMVTTTFSSKDSRKPLLCSPSQCDPQEMPTHQYHHLQKTNIIPIQPFIMKPQPELPKNNSSSKLKKRKLFKTSEFDDLPVIDE